MNSMFKTVVVLITLAMATSMPAHAVEYEVPSNAQYPHAKVTPVNGSTQLCSTWADPRVCDLDPGVAYKLHRFTPDWQGNFTIIRIGTAEPTVEGLQRTIAYLRDQIDTMNASIRRLNITVRNLNGALAQCQGGSD